ncbi:MAG: NAD(P)-dependent alcohol dehydrogenase, partial [Methanomassiliicoccales archaeon]|nr:NAD(P)-dependent alcohol dehydrogenase [Methanomassiliicoccales archaeon]
MRAIVYTEYGQPEVLQLKEVEKPVPKDNEVLVRVHAASVNSWDWDLLRGKPFLNRAGGLLRPRYEILGADIAGKVEAVGKNVKELQPGDEVFGDLSQSGWGGFAEFARAQESALAMKSSRMTFEQAAAVPQAGVLALQGLRHKGGIQPGNKVLINGAGGGVGTFAVQIAKSLGAEVTGVDSAEKSDMIRSIGADQVIDYAREQYTRNGETYDLILDVVASRPMREYRRSLRPSGRFVLVGGATGTALKVVFLGPLFSLFGSRKLGGLIHKPNRTDLNALSELFESGKAIPV